MKVFFICKRYYTGKDVISHRFGRLYELPSQLARLGHEIVVLCVDYRERDVQESFIEQFGIGSVRWIPVGVRTIMNLEAGHIYRSIKEFRADLVIGSSDIPCLWLSKAISSKLQAPYIVDLYDNYESFGQSRIPGFRRLLKFCVRNANAVISVSDSLRRKVVAEYLPQGQVFVMSNGVSMSRFYPGDRRSARVSLGLPVDGRLVGTAGTLSAMKGLDTVCEAWRHIQCSEEDVYLVLAGSLGKGFSLPDGARVIYLGELLESDVAELFRALDVGIIPAHDSAFGRYCFPQKLFEMVACDLPVVGARVGSIETALQGSPQMLFEPGSADSLAAAVLGQLVDPKFPDIKPLTWSELVGGIEPVFTEYIKKA